MLSISTLSEDYLAICQYQKKLDSKTIKAYRIDLHQFCNFIEQRQNNISKATISKYIMSMNQSYKPRSVKRKIATLKAFLTIWMQRESSATIPSRNSQLACVNHYNFREPSRYESLSQ